MWGVPADMPALRALADAHGLVLLEDASHAHGARIGERKAGTFGDGAAFSMNGLGAYLVQAAESKDLAVVQGISLVLVAAFVLINALVDVLYAALDPRVALGSRAQ